MNVFLKEARQILSHVQRAARLALAASRGEAGQLSVAILPPIGGLFLPPAIREFREQFPVVDLTIVDLLPQEQITALMDRRIDIGFVPLPVVEMNPALEFEPVREVELMAALPPGHRLAKQRRLANLLTKNQRVDLSLQERRTLTALRAEADRLMLQRAYASVLLKYRGHPVSHLRDR